jgi:uncharacterized membrane protein YiaA
METRAENSIQKKAFKVAGFLAIFGGIVCYVSDHYLRGGFAPGPAVGLMEGLEAAPYTPVLFGSILGYAVLPFYLLGLWPLYRALKPAGRFLASVPVFLFGFAFTLFPGYHHAAVLYALGFKAATENADSLLAAQLAQVHESALLVIAIPMTIASLWMAVLVLSGKTRYARWMAIVSPLLAPLISPLLLYLPDPWGGYLVPGAGTLVFVLFFALTVWVSWPGSRTNESIDPKVILD